jgi:diaminopimelate epimerase
MRVRFQKMNGAGNDFVMIDNREGRLKPDGNTVRALCDRKRGIGGDGMILIEKDESADFRMRYFNSDGGEAPMCGNGARCAAVFAREIGLGERAGDELRLTFTTGAGPLRAVVRGDRVRISMTDAVKYEGPLSLRVPGGQEIVHVIDTGVPHAVCVEEDWSRLGDADVVERGRRIRCHERFAPEGVNVDFVHIRGDGRAGIRTYERGVENETLACGTGAVAAAVVLARLALAGPPVDLLTQGGDLLRVSFSPTADGAGNVLLEGPATVNFEGMVELSTKE